MFKVFLLFVFALSKILFVDSAQLVKAQNKCVFVLASAEWSSVAKDEVGFNEDDGRLEKRDDLKELAHAKEYFEAAVSSLLQLAEDWITLIILFVVEQDRQVVKN